MPSRLETLLNAVINGETIEFTPRSRMEEYLKNCINKAGVEGLPDPRSRADALLYMLSETIASGESGSGSGDPDISAIEETLTSIIELQESYIGGNTDVNNS